VNVQHLVETGGYGVVFALVLAEALGVPVPGETAVVAAGAYAGATGRLSVWAVFVAAFAAAVAGSMAGYWIGHWGGYRLVRRFGRRFGVDEPQLKVARYLFDRRGVTVVVLGRFVAILRTYVSLLAGTARMAFPRFAAAAAGGSLAWAALYAFASYSFGNVLRRVSAVVTIVLVAAIVVVTAVTVVVVRRHLGRLEAAAEAAYPGPLEP
jgi:membrane protein DedA with SNARE-associated domain